MHIKGERWTIEDITEWVKINRPNYEVLSPIYWHPYIDLRCSNGHIFYIDWNSFCNCGVSCPICKREYKEGNKEEKINVKINIKDKTNSKKIKVEKNIEDNDNFKNIDGVIYRKCNECGEWKPHTAEFFSKSKGCIRGLSAVCKNCKNSKNQEYSKKRYHELGGKEYNAEYYKNKNNTGWYVYEFLDNDNNIIYIGRTTGLERRMKEHGSEGHLPKECYDKVQKIFYSELGSNVDMKIYESYYISKYKPIYNEKNKSFGDTKLILPDLEWYECEMDYINKSCE